MIDVVLPVVRWGWVVGVVLGQRSDLVREVLVLMIDLVLEIPGL